MEPTLNARGYSSAELTHFIGRALPTDEERFQLLVHIVRRGWLTYPPHNEQHEARFTVYRRRLASQDAMYVPHAVCFCDIPVEHLALHMSKYSKFGLSFQKAFLVGKGATPVFYLAMDSSVWKKRPEFAGSGAYKPTSEEERKAIVEALGTIDETRWKRIVRSQAIDEELAKKWDLFYERLEFLKREDVPADVLVHLAKAHQQDITWDMLVFGFLKLFEAGRPDSDPEHYYLEREWRVADNVDLQTSDLARIIVPHAFKDRVAADLPDFVGPVTTVD